MLYSNLYYMSICDPVASFSWRLLKQINPKLVEIVIRMFQVLSIQELWYILGAVSVHTSLSGKS